VRTGAAPARKGACCLYLSTLALFNELIRLLFPTLGYPTTPTVMLCALGLYALRRRRREGAVEDERCARWVEDAERKGRVGVVCRR
jgi:uncharacterized protein (TIGR03382 family)